ncbi:LamG domain-containing protein [Streptomyces sp. SKN60]|uniref:LamG domain-containing protein n=1 Tax=Streptomyces sp. SKN60 TaxID=2855506 RepID=UPI0022455408|nr:LamG domain-containing protein [Streptomyces sp. SKN60]MCX2184207.1 LamG domain-containing protein [Streptomyces sp. SKN60]
MSGRRRGGARAAVVGGCLAAVVGAGVAVPGAAYAVDNLPPKQPLVQDLQNNFKPCATGDEPFYTGQPPVLTALLSDPAEDDRIGYQELVSGEFEIWWTDAAGAEQRRSFTTYQQHNDRIHRITVPSDIPADTVISWRVRANDGTLNGAWSSDAPSGAACRFVYDNESPKAPSVSSPEFPAETWWGGGVGTYGSFTLDSPSPDVVEYRYSLIDAPGEVVLRPTELGGPVTFRYAPLSNAPQRVEAYAIDRSGRRSGTTYYTFYPKAASAPVSEWKLADPAGSTTAAAETGKAAQAGDGVTFGGPVPSGTSLTSTATLNGSSHAHLTTDTPAVGTGAGKTFAIGAWVRPAATGQSMTVASQDATDEAAYSLGLDVPEGGPAAWSFAIGDAKVTGGAPETGEWAYLLGIYDVETGYAQLFVNGHEVGAKVKAAPATSDGAFQIGRVLSKTGYKHRWNGEIGDVRAYDRLVVPAEVSELARRKPKLLGHWSFSTEADGATPEQNGGAPLKLASGATIYRNTNNNCLPDIDPDCTYQPPPLVGDGNLRLDGTSGYAATEGPVVDTGNSFTIGVLVRIADEDATRPMTVLSQAGEHTDAFKLRYEPSTYSWQLIVPERDEAGAPEKVVSQVEMPSGSSGWGTRLAVVYDDASDTLKLFADGYTNAGATTHLPNGWKSTGALTVGRSRTADGWGEYLKGDVDEIQAYEGALEDDDIIGLGWEPEPCLCY